VFALGGAIDLNTHSLHAALPIVFGFLAMMVFLFVLVVGFIYEWKKGALEWD